MKAVNAKLNVFLVANHQEVAQEILELFIRSAQKAIDVNDRFCTAISRNTPRIFFELLGSDLRSKSLPWNQIHFFCADECCGLSELSNNSYILMTNALAQKVNMPSENVHRICSKCRNCEQAALIYEQTISNVIERKGNGAPRLDLVLLQMATDGHIASLFPDTYAFFERKRLVQVSHFIDTRRTRITVTHPLLCAASQIVVLVSGSKKAKILSEIFTRETNIAQYPIHALWPIIDKVTWLVDHDAASSLLPLHSVDINRRNAAFARQYAEGGHEND